jgi:hypothetical protein
LVNAKIILSVATFLLINLLLSSSYADSDIAALGDLKGIYVNLKINDRTPPGMPRQRIDKKKLLKYVEKKLTNTIGKERGIRLFKSIDPHFNVKVIIEGQEHHSADKLQTYMYHVTVEASLERNAAEWYQEYTESWEKNAKRINSAKESVRKAKSRLNKAKKAPYLLSQKSSHTRGINSAARHLAYTKKSLASTIERYAIRHTAEGMLGKIIYALAKDYRIAKKMENEYKKNEQEVEELRNQLGYKEETITSKQKNKRYVKSENLSLKNILYEIGNTIKLRNPSDKVFAFYKDDSLSNATNIFTNGINATIMDYKALPDKSFVYKMQMFLKDGSEHIGWVPESNISSYKKDTISAGNIGSATRTTYHRDDHIYKLLKDSTDYINITDNQKFKDYINNLPLQKHRAAIRIIEAGTKEEIFDLISNYKSQEDYQESHRLMIKDAIDNYDVFDESRAISILQDWINKEEDNAKVIRLSVEDNSSNRFVQTYLVTYTITKGTGQQKFMYEYTSNTKSTRKMVYMHNED